MVIVVLPESLDACVGFASGVGPGHEQSQSNAHVAKLRYLEIGHRINRLDDKIKTTCLVLVSIWRRTTTYTPCMSGDDNRLEKTTS